MSHRIIEQVLERASKAKEESDFTYFFSLLLAGEAAMKTIASGMLAGIADDSERHRYRLEHAAVRADGLGEWSKVIDDALTGPASQFLLADVRTEQTELTRVCREGDWQYEAVRSLKQSMDQLGVDAEELPVRSDMKRWFRLFATLRNKTRAHGATKPADAGAASTYLFDSINLIYGNLSLFRRPWAYLYRNLSGKYRISAISGDTSVFDYLKRTSTFSFANGVYVFLGQPRRIPLVASDPEVQDIFLANGSFNGKRYELISYSTDDRLESDAGPYLTPPGTLPVSETQGHGELLPKGKCFSNVPEPAKDYVARAELEADLFRLLVDDRRPIVTLVGAGGAGKTSLTLQVVRRLYDETRFEVIIWFSARDIDLLPAGVKPVRPSVLSPEDIASRYARLVLSDDQAITKGSDLKAFFERQLQRSELGPCLFVFDNFETVQSPIEMFNWIDTYIRLPNKVLITTRLRDFKGDYPVELRGMTPDESRTLVDQTARYLGIQNLLTTEYVDKVISSSEGHPYVIKILLGEVASSGKMGAIPRIVASRDEVLVALFERTYAALSPCAQRAFLTLSAWNSAVPRVALEAVLLRSIDERSEVEKGVESLLHYSLAQVRAATTDQQEFISLPLVASFFGRKKLQISPFKAAIQADVETLQMLGPSRADDVHLGLATRIERFIANVSTRVDGGESLEGYESVLEMMCRAYNPGWVLLAQWRIERDSPADFEAAKAQLRKYLENNPAGSHSAQAWRMLARACFLTGDQLGEVHALIERSQLDSVPFHDVANTANLLNRLLKEHGLEFEREERRELARRLLAVLQRRTGEAGADDFAKMAWLAIHVGQQTLAIEHVRRGLELDPTNDHCLRLSDRLGLR